MNFRVRIFVKSAVKVIDKPKMSEIRILNLCHEKLSLVDIQTVALLKVRVNEFGSFNAFYPLASGR